MAVGAEVTGAVDSDGAALTAAAAVAGAEPITAMLALGTALAGATLAGAPPLCPQPATTMSNVTDIAIDLLRRTTGLSPRSPRRSASPPRRRHDPPIVRPRCARPFVLERSAADASTASSIAPKANSESGGATVTE